MSETVKTVQREGKPHKVHVWVYDTYCGTYDFATTEEADADFEYRKHFEAHGCRYMRESRDPLTPTPPTPIDRL